MMNDHEKSDRIIVPANPRNNAGPTGPSADGGEERKRTKENPGEQNGIWTQRRTVPSNALERIHQAATRDKKLQFTALLHHIYDLERLRAAYKELNPRAAAGVDGVTWEQYGQDLKGNLEDLSSRLKTGAYRAKPVQRAYIPKPDGGQRPLGIPALEDKIVQRATAEVLGAIYEADFIGFSYGFRRGRGTHDALDALYVALVSKKVNWVLDADIRGFFDALDHGWLVRFLEHRIADKRVLRLIQKWLKVGVIEDGLRCMAESGTPQGGSISPLLANIYLHYVFDLWAHAWRRKRANGDIIVVRYADDYIVGFQHHSVAETFLADLRVRLARFGLELHPDKTRLIEFGRFAIRDRRRRGEGKPKTFDFLGFTHMCSTGRGGGFVIRRQTIRKRLLRALQRIKKEIRRRMHYAVPKVGRWLFAVIDGYFNYHAVPTNGRSMAFFHRQIGRYWHRALGRRSQKGHVTWERMKRLIAKWFPPVSIRHPWPWERFRRCHHPR